MNTTYAWAPITKIEDKPDGTVMVYGPMTDAGLDRDRQGLNQEWLDGAVPAWMKEGANVREQHMATRAVGVGVQLDRRDDGTFDLGSHVVDPIAVTKVKAGVLKGYSVGIKDPQINMGNPTFPNGEIVGGSIIEVSLVDRPSNPRTLFTMVKADAAGDLEEVEEPEVEEVEPDALKFVSASARRRYASQGVAMANGDFPIQDAGHLKAAIGLLGGYTGDKQAAKAHIISRARALDLASSLPADWGVADGMAKAEQVLTELTVLLPDLTKADEAGDIATAQQAIALIGKLIGSEAASLAAGAYGEDQDICCLLDAFRALKYFIQCEEQEMEPNPNPDSMSANIDDSMAIAGSAYEMKTDTAPATAPAATDTPEVTKVENADWLAKVDAAVAEAKSLRDELTLVKADLAKVMAMPETGGPVAMRTASQAAAARGVDATSLRREAADYIAKSDAISREDPVAARGYRDKAAELLAKADA